MVTKPTGNARGRPRGTGKGLLQDPERHTIPFAWACQAIGYSERKAFKLAAVYVCGKEVTGPVLMADDGRVLKSSLLWQRRGYCTWFDELAESLKQKANRTQAKKLGKQRRVNVPVGYTPEEAAWLSAMGGICLLALAPKVPDLSIALINNMSCVLGEEEFAHRVLVPLAKSGGFNPALSVPPDLLHSRLPTTSHDFPTQCDY